MWLFFIVFFTVALLSISTSCFALFCLFFFFLPQSAYFTFMAKYLGVRAQWWWMILYEFPTTVTSYHRTGGLKYYYLTVLEARSLKSLLTDLKSKGNQGLFYPEDSEKRIRFPVSRGQLHSLVHGPFLHLQGHQWA